MWDVGWTMDDGWMDGWMMDPSKPPTANKEYNARRRTPTNTERTNNEHRTNERTATHNKESQKVIKSRCLFGHSVILSFCIDTLLLTTPN